MTIEQLYKTADFHIPSGIDKKEWDSFPVWKKLPYAYRFAIKNIFIFKIYAAGKTDKKHAGKFRIIKQCGKDNVCSYSDSEEWISLHLHNDLMIFENPLDAANYIEYNLIEK